MMKVRNMHHGEGPYIEDTEFSRGDSFQPIEGDHRKCGRSVVSGPGLAIHLKRGMVQVVTPGALARCETCLKSYVIAPEMGFLEEVDRGS